MTGLNHHEMKELEDLIREKILDLKKKNAIPVTQDTDRLVKHMLRVFEKIPELTPALLKSKQKEFENIILFTATLSSNPEINAAHDPRLLEKLSEKFAFLLLNPRHLPEPIRLQMFGKLFKEINELEPNPALRLEDKQVEQLAQAMLKISPEENEYLNGAQKALVQANGVDKFFQEVFLAITFKNPNSAYFESNDSQRPASSPFAMKNPLDTKLVPPTS